MANLKELIIRLTKEDSGQDLIEYALVAALIGLGAITTITSVGTEITALFSKVSSSLVAAGG